jgi:hypothetical protein
MTETVTAPELAADDYERLGSVWVGGQLHAMYPTALRTLCLREHEAPEKLSGQCPTCSACMEVVNAWRNVRPRIEGLCIPRSWFPERTESD